MNFLSILSVSTLSKEETRRKKGGRGGKKEKGKGEQNEIR